MNIVGELSSKVMGIPLVQPPPHRPVLTDASSSLLSRGEISVDSSAEDKMAKKKYLGDSVVYCVLYTP